jgi:hypothetical protein
MIIDEIMVVQKQDMQTSESQKLPGLIDVKNFTERGTRASHNTACSRNSCMYCTKNFLAAACARAPNLYRRPSSAAAQPHPCRTVRQGRRRSACVSQVRCDVHHLPAEYVRIRPRRLSDISVLHSKSVLHGGLYGYGG